MTQHRHPFQIEAIGFANGDDIPPQYTRDGKEIPVDYRMHQVDGRWSVYDVSIQGVSLVSNYRTQFNRVVTTESYESLVQKLRDKDVSPAASGRTS